MTCQVDTVGLVHEIMTAVLLAALLVGAGCVNPESRAVASASPSQSEQPAASIASDVPTTPATAPASSSSTLPQKRLPAPTFSSFTVIEECPFQCWEPSVAVDPLGRIFVAGAIESPIQQSVDGGLSFEPVALPPALEASQGNRFDALVHVDPVGRLWYSALADVSGTTSQISDQAVRLHGIQVARSDDGGATWAANQYLSIVESPDEPAYGADRQWLGFAPDGTAYLVYSSVGYEPQTGTLFSTGLWSARSDDGGAAWTAWTRAAPFEERMQIGQHGPPVVDAAGHVHIPAFADPLGPVFGRQFNVYTSVDKGVTWTTGTIAAWPVGSGNWLPNMALGADGALHVAWVNAAERRVYVATSVDDGATWSTPTAWTPEGANVELSAWLIPHPNGNLDVAWFRDDETSVSAFVTRGTLEAPGRTYELATGLTGPSWAPSQANTDFAYGVPLGDRSVVVLSDWGTGAMTLSFG